MDNATYHSVQVEKLPTSSWLKADLCSWLAEKAIAHSSHATRKQLYELCKQYRPCKQHRVDISYMKLATVCSGFLHTTASTILLSWCGATARDSSTTTQAEEIDLTTKLWRTFGLKHCLRLLQKSGRHMCATLKS